MGKRKALKNATKIVSRYKNRPGALISILEDIQGACGYLPKEILEQVSEKLDTPLSRLFSMATFYSAFSLKPRGQNTLRVCLGTACHVRGSARILKDLSHQLGVKPGDTTEDRKFTLETVRCVGCCSLAPVIKVNNDTHGHTTADKIRALMAKYKR